MWLCAGRADELRMVERRVYAVNANWKLVIQNYSECLHCPTRCCRSSRTT